MLGNPRRHTIGGASSPEHRSVPLWQILAVATLAGVLLVLSVVLLMWINTEHHSGDSTLGSRSATFVRMGPGGR